MEDHRPIGRSRCTKSTRRTDRGIVCTFDGLIAIPWPTSASATRVVLIKPHGRSQPALKSKIVVRQFG